MALSHTSICRSHDCRSHAETLSLPSLKGFDQGFQKQRPSHKLSEEKVPVNSTFRGGYICERIACDHRILLKGQLLVSCEKLLPDRILAMAQQAGGGEARGDRSRTIPIDVKEVLFLLLIQIYRRSVANNRHQYSAMTLQMATHGWCTF